MRAAFAGNFSQSEVVNKPNYMLFCDGACSGNPGPGGWAFVAANPYRVWEQAGFRSQTTNNQMELEALRQGLKWIYEHRREFFGHEVGSDKSLPEQQLSWESGHSPLSTPSLTDSKAVTLAIYLDSQYVLKLINWWLPKWKAQGWKTQAGEPVKNRELIESIDSLIQAFPCRVEWFYVPGHEGIVGNERVDELSVAAIAQGVSPLHQTPQAKLEREDTGESPQNQGVDILVHAQSYTRREYAYHLEVGLERAKDLKSLVFEEKKSRIVSEAAGIEGFPLYVAHWQGEWREFKDWPSCQAWVSGKSGVQYKKVKNQLEYEEFAQKYRCRG